MKNWIALRVFSKDNYIRLCLEDAPPNIGYQQIDQVFVLHPQIGPPLPIGCRLFVVQNSLHFPYHTLLVENVKTYIHRYVPYTDGFFFIAFTRPVPSLQPFHVLNLSSKVQILDKDDGNSAIVTFHVAESPFSKWIDDTDGYCLPSNHGYPTLLQCQQRAIFNPYQSNMTFLGHSYSRLFLNASTESKWIWFVILVLIAMMLLSVIYMLIKRH